MVQTLEKKIEARLRRVIDTYQHFGVKTLAESKSEILHSLFGISEKQSNEGLLKEIIKVLREEKLFEQQDQQTVQSLSNAVENLSGVILEMMKPVDEED